MACERERICLVEVDEGLVLRVVREASARRCASVPGEDRSGKRVRMRMDCRSGSASGADHGPATSGVPSARRWKRLASSAVMSPALAGMYVSLQEPFGRIDVQVVGQVDDVHHEIDLGIALVHPHVQVAERRRVSGCREHRQQQRGENAEDENPHGGGGQW